MPKVKNAKDSILEEAIATCFAHLSSDDARTDCIRRLRDEFCLKCGNHTPESNCRCRR
jgi:hypothetical protein